MKEFPVAVGINGVVLELDPGALRELHWHPNADEWQYWIEGSGRVGMFGSHGRSRVEEFGHSIQNTGKDPLKVLIGFNGGEYQAIDALAWLASNPKDLLAANFNTPPSTFDAFPRKRVFTAPRKATRRKARGLARADRPPRD